MHTGVLPWPKGADWDRAPKRKARQTRGASRLAQVQDIPIEYEEEVPFQRYGGPASYWSATRSSIGIMIRRRGRGRGRRNARDLETGNPLEPCDQRTTREAAIRRVGSLGDLEIGRLRRDNYRSRAPAPLASEHAIDKEPPKRPGERGFVNAPSGVTIEGSAISDGRHRLRERRTRHRRAPIRWHQV